MNQVELHGDLHVDHYQFFCHNPFTNKLALPSDTREVVCQLRISVHVTKAILRTCGAHTEIM